MTATIVTNKGGGPVVGSMRLTGAEVDTPVTFSNQDNTGVSGWRWDILDAPADSPTLNPLPPPDFTNSTIITPDVKGHSILVKLTTYTDVARTIIDDTDQVVLGVQFDPPFDWTIPAAGQSIEADMIRGWASDVNRMLRELNAFITAGGGSVDWKNSVRGVINGDLLPAHNRVGNVITAAAVGALPLPEDGITYIVDDEVMVIYLSPDTNAGVYVINQLGDGLSPWIMTRRSDLDDDADVTAGLRVPVGPEGTLYGGKVMELLTADPITVNGTALLFRAVESGSLDVVLSPAALAADQDDYAPVGIEKTTILRLDPSGADRTVTGIFSQEALPTFRTKMTIHNISATYNLLLTHQDVGSLVADNRFNMPGGVTMVLGPGDSWEFYIDTADGSWRPV